MSINKPITHKSFVIQMQGEGFKFVSHIAGKIASFWVVSNEPKVRSMFAFATSMLDSFENEGDSEEKMIELAVTTIKQYIDDNKIQDLEEYTFKYKSHAFIPDENPKWWTKSLRTLLKI